MNRTLTADSLTTIDEALKFYEGALGLRCEKIEEVGLPSR